MSDHREGETDYDEGVHFGPPTRIEADLRGDVVAEGWDHDLCDWNNAPEGDDKV